MKQRDRLIIREHELGVRRAERADQERRERPIREATEQLNETHRQLRSVLVERLLGNVRDPDPIAIDPAVAQPFAFATQQQADAFNRDQFKKYKDEHPNVYWTPELVDQVGAYLDKNSLRIVTASMIDAVVCRYLEAGLLPDPPEPEPVPQPEPTQVPQEETEPELLDGWDLQSGEPRKWTHRELDRLSSADYRRALRLYKERLTVPNLGPGGRNE